MARGRHVTHPSLSRRDPSTSRHLSGSLKKPPPFFKSPTVYTQDINRIYGDSRARNHQPAPGGPPYPSRARLGRALIFDRKGLRTPPICCAGCQFHFVTHRTNLSSPPHTNILSTRRFLIHSPGVPPLQIAARIMILKERSYAEVNQISPYLADSCG
jgi:hypothetical protein